MRLFGQMVVGKVCAADRVGAQAFKAAAAGVSQPAGGPRSHNARPRSWCGCRGTDYEQPFECPLDFMLAPHALRDNSVQYRPAGFLQLPQVRWAGLGHMPVCCLLWLSECSATTGWLQCHQACIMLQRRPAVTAGYCPCCHLALPATQVPAALRRSRAAVDIAASKPADLFPKPATTVGHAATAWQGITQGDLLRVVEPVDAVAVLVLRCAAGARRCCRCC